MGNDDKLFKQKNPEQEPTNEAHFYKNKINDQLFSPKLGRSKITPTIPMLELSRWRQELRDRLANRSKDYESKHPVPRPYLHENSTFDHQIDGLGYDEQRPISLTVFNAGNLPSWTCYVELYEIGHGVIEAPFGHLGIPPRPVVSVKLCEKTIITLHPGQQKLVELHFKRQFLIFDIVGVVFDPILDPRDFSSLEDNSRQITRFSYRLHI